MNYRFGLSFFLPLPSSPWLQLTATSSNGGCHLFMTKRELGNIVLEEGSGSFFYLLKNNSSVTVNSMYTHLINTGLKFFSRSLAFEDTTLKIKIFKWLLKRGVILTKDNLARNSNESKLCAFCC